MSNDYSVLFPSPMKRKKLVTKKAIQTHKMTGTFCNYHHEFSNGMFLVNKP